LTIHRGLLAPDEITTVGRIVATTPRRTAYDLACGLPLVEAVERAGAAEGADDGVTRAQ
jgi:hypothetical protein